MRLDYAISAKNPSPLRTRRLKTTAISVDGKITLLIIIIIIIIIFYKKKIYNFSRYRGAAHNSCNLNYQDSRTIPVVFHNLSGYDSHLFIKELANTFKGTINLIPENKEKYISFTKTMDDSIISFRFMDSSRFMPSSLDKLASYLENLDIVEKEFQNEYSSMQIELLKRKGVFP